MARRFNTKLIRKRRTYTTKDIAALFGMHTRSVQQWIAKNGLSPIEGSSNPYLIYGETLYDFLTQKKQKRKCSLQANEFYCFKCKCGRDGISVETTITKTATRIGNKGKFKEIRESKCEVCSIKLFRFYTYQREVSDEIN
jgi:ribosome biogenesis SPOUT family RNA methylase Rps3